MATRGRGVSSDLVDELGGKRDPEFEMDVPPGWTRHQPDDATLQRMTKEMRRRLMGTHRPDLYADMKLLLERSFEDMRRDGVFAFFSATNDDSRTLFLPASINASIRRAGPGESLDELVRRLISTQGAEPLLGDQRTIRFESERTVRTGTDTVVNHTVIYLTPIPGSKRRRALQLTAGFARPVEMPSDDAWLERMRELFDACVASVRWRAPSAQ